MNHNWRRQKPGFFKKPGFLVMKLMVLKMDEAGFFRRVLSIVEAEFSDIRWVLHVEDGLLVADEDTEYGLRNLLVSVQLQMANGKSLEQCVVRHFRDAINGMREDLDALSTEAAIRALYPLLSIPLRSQGIDLFEEPAPGLQKCLVVDLPGGFRYVCTKRLTNWGLSPTEAFEIAAENLASRSHHLSMEILEDWPGNPLLINLADGYDATRVTISDCRQQISNLLGETFWIAIPTRDELLACAANISKRTHRQLQERVESAFKQMPYPLSPLLHSASISSFPCALPKQTSWWQRILG